MPSKGEDELLEFSAAESVRVPSDLELIVPISSDWTSLGRGGGIETFLKMFLANAARIGMKVTVLCSGAEGGANGSVRFIPLMSHAESELAFTRQLGRALRKGTVRIPSGAIVLANEEHYAWAFRRLDTPIILMSHGVIPETLGMRHSGIFVGAYRFFIERAAVKLARRVVVVNSNIKRYYLSRYRSEPPEKFIEIPVGLDLEELEHRPRGKPLEGLSLSAATEFVLFVGRLYPEKNVGLFISACDLLRQGGTATEAVVVGDGIEAKIIREAMQKRPWLHWIPVMGRTEVLDAMASSRALVICSRYEAGPLVLLEALGLGIPVVSTDVGRARELVASSLGRIVGGDAASIAAAMTEVLSWKAEDVRRASEAVMGRLDFRETMRSIISLLISIRHEDDS